MTPIRAAHRLRARARHLLAEPALFAVVILALLATFSQVAISAEPSATPRLTADVHAPLVTNCDGGSWSTTHLLVWGSGCEALFGVIYANDFSNWNASQSYNFSFSIPAIAEVSPAGQLVRYADPMNPGAATTTVATSPGEVNITLQEQINVTSGSGGWAPNDTAWGSGPQWSNGTVVLGVTSLAVVFHLLNTSNSNPANTTYRVKFDLDVASWPWADAGDALGVGFQALGAGGAHFSFNGSTSALVESWDGNGTSFVNLTFGEGADVSYPSGPDRTAAVTTQSGLFAGGTPDRQAVVLLTFGSVPGDFSGLAYDPWVSFAVGPSGGSASHAPSLLGVPASGAPAVALTAGAVAVVAGSSTVGWYVRRRQLQRAGESLVAGIEQVISDGPPPRP